MRKRTAKIIGISVGIAAIIAAGLGIGISVSGILRDGDAANELNVNVGNVNDADTQNGDENGSDGVHNVDDTEDDASAGDANDSSTSATQNGGTSETTSEIATDDTIEQDVDTTLEVTDKLTKDASTSGVEELLEYADVDDIESKQDTTNLLYWAYRVSEKDDGDSRAGLLEVQRFNKLVANGEWYMDTSDPQMVNMDSETVTYVRKVSVTPKNNVSGTDIFDATMTYTIECDRQSGKLLSIRTELDNYNIYEMKPSMLIPDDGSNDNDPPLLPDPPAER